MSTDAAATAASVERLRFLARMTDPVSLAQSCDPSFKPRPHAKAIGRGIMRCRTTPGAKILITCPPQVGKSTTAAVWGVFWWLILHPTDNVIIASYGSELAEERGRAIRKLIRAYGGDFGLKLDPERSSVADWRLTSGGGVRCAGIGGSLTGHPCDCVTGDSDIIVPGETVSIAEFVARGGCGDVLSYNHGTQRTEWRRVEATRVLEERAVLDVTTTAGRRLRCTPDHLIHTDAGYVAAKDLVPGQRLLGIGDLPVPDRFPAGSLRVQQEGAPGHKGHDVLASLPRRADAPTHRAPLSALRHAAPTRAGEAPQVLLTGMPVDEGSQRGDASAQGMPAVQHPIPASDIAHDLLHTGLREHGARLSHDGAGQLPLQERQQLRGMVPGHATASDGTRPAPLRHVQSTRVLHRGVESGQDSEAHDVPRPPHQRGSEGQPSREPDHAVQDVPRGTPQIEYDTVAVVGDVRPERERVYDLQVEGNHNFFADQVLVHNCLIIDDPHKNRQEADSPTSRKRVANSYSSDLVSRLGPGAPTLLILTRWHEDDLAGRLLRDERRVEEGGDWTVIHMPAIADQTLTGPDPLGRQDGDPLSHPKIPSRDREALLAHWSRKRRGSSPFDWGALYQGNPQPVEGALTSAELMRHQTQLTGLPAPARIGVAVDPSGGGRDSAGVIGGYMGRDGRLYWTHDRSAVMSSDAWSRAACQLAAETGAQVVVVEKNFGGDQAELAVKGAWDKLRREHDERHEQDEDPLKNPYATMPPLVQMRSVKLSKILRAEPVAGQLREDRIRLADHMPELVAEWCQFQPDSSFSPGRIDASVLLAYELLGPPRTVNAVAAPSGSREQIAGRTTGQGRRIARRSYGGGRD